MSIFRNENIRLWLLSQRWFLLVVELKFKEGFSCYSWYWYSSDNSLVLSDGIRNATLTWIVFYFLLHPLSLSVALFFDFFFWSDLVLSFDSLLKLSGYAFLVKFWLCSSWPGLVCQVQMWSMIENNICAWNSYFYEFDFACA